MSTETESKIYNSVVDLIVMNSPGFNFECNDESSTTRVNAETILKLLWFSNKAKSGYQSWYRKCRVSDLGMVETFNLNTGEWEEQEISLSMKEHW